MNVFLPEKKNGNTCSNDFGSWKIQVAQEVVINSLKYPPKFVFALFKNQTYVLQRRIWCKLENQTICETGMRITPQCPAQTSPSQCEALPVLSKLPLE